MEFAVIVGSIVTAFYYSGGEPRFWIATAYAGTAFPIGLTAIALYAYLRGGLTLVPLSAVPVYVFAAMLVAPGIGWVNSWRARRKRKSERVC